MKTETTREIAERIAKAHVNWPQGYKAFARAVAAIEAELNARDERAAKIAEDDDFTHASGHRCHRGEFIANEIRGSKQ